MDVEQFENPAWNERTPALGGRMLRVLLKDFVLLLVLLGIGEVGVRVFGPQYARHIFTKTLTGGYPQIRNSYGLRDGEFPRERPAGEKRVLCLGDSTTRGAGVAGEHTYAKQLEGLLNTRGGGSRYLVINGGGEGRSLGHAQTFLEKDGLAFGPSVVVLGFSPAMLAVAAQEEAGRLASRPAGAAAGGPLGWKQWLKKIRRGEAMQKSYLYVFLDVNVRRLLYVLGVLQAKPVGPGFAYAFDMPGVKPEAVEAAYRILRARLAETKAMLLRRGIPFVVMGIPGQFEISDLGFDNPHRFPVKTMRISPQDRVAEYCRELGIPYVDLRPRLRAERQAMREGALPWNPLFIPVDEWHLIQYGMRIAAEELLGVIDAQGWLEPAVKADFEIPRRDRAKAFQLLHPMGVFGRVSDGQPLGWEWSIAGSAQANRIDHRVEVGRRYSG